MTTPGAVWGVWISLTALVVTGCDQPEPVLTETDTQAMRPVQTPADRALPYARLDRRAAAPVDAIQAGGACACGDDRSCAALCAYDESLLDAARGGIDDDCIMCGRETGFLPAPVLELDHDGDGRVELAWDAVSGARTYVLHALRWTDNPASGTGLVASMDWETERTVVRTRLQPGFSYTFFVVAIAGDRKARSAPSNVVRLDL